MSPVRPSFTAVSLTRSSIFLAPEESDTQPNRVFLVVQLVEFQNQWKWGHRVRESGPGFAGSILTILNLTHVIGIFLRHRSCDYFMTII